MFLCDFSIRFDLCQDQSMDETGCCYTLVHFAAAAASLALLTDDENEDSAIISKLEKKKKKGKERGGNIVGARRTDVGCISALF